MITQDLDTIKELKVRVPARYHQQLQVIKLLKGQNISDSVRAALDDYFAIPENRAKAGLLAGAALPAANR